MESDKIDHQEKKDCFSKIFCCIKFSSSIKAREANKTGNSDDCWNRKKVNRKDRFENHFDSKCNKSSLELIEENSSNGVHNDFFNSTVKKDEEKSGSPPSFVASSLIYVWNDSIKLNEPNEIEIFPINSNKKNNSYNKLEEMIKNNSEKNSIKKNLNGTKISFNESGDSCCTSDDDTGGFLGGLSLNSHEALNHIIRCFPFTSSKNNHSQKNKGMEYCINSNNIEENDKILRTQSVNDGRKNKFINNFKNKKIDFNKSDNFNTHHNETSWKDIKRHFSASFNQVIHRKDTNNSISRPSNLNLNGTNEIDESISAPVTPSINIMSHTTPTFLNFAKTKKNVTLNRNNSRNNNTSNSALSKLCQVSVDTMAITALPLDCWLKERLKSWVQLSGHEGTIIPASNHTLWKKQPTLNTIEAQAYQQIMNDPWLIGLTPKYYKEIFHKNESFIEIQDLLSQFSDTENRAIMDIKIGQRTFLESEVVNQKKRPDLYKKMIEIDPNEPTEEEHNEGAITKLRYMQFRERESSTASLGFRIEAAKTSEGALKKNFKKIKTPEQIKETLLNFFEDYDTGKIRRQVLERLYEMREKIEKSTFFKYHEVVGSSLLIVHDRNKSGVWMIDFAKSNKVEDSSPLDHRRPWELGNHEDGYLVGIDNLIKIIESIDERNENIN
ncbi:Inositol 1,4,5-triphosphate kinase 1 [Strongyloides ratti]|uniref:Kinase n=1 Tax=Strongyloides ratti TaxID=34506 RepID=A0A090MYT3_STRRB|nr:Inositol 1,4,5-triphosphate kinase 1 [Strongyloides ratti]CEF67734.1 Inositol 1,4,5-triphosphate kinase 1 [Strongyloides ratti]